MTGRARLIDVLLLVLALACSGGCSTGGISIAQERRTVAADDGFPLVAYTLFAWKGGEPRDEARARDPAGILVYVQGSEDRTVLGVTEHLAGACAMGLDVIAVERRGVAADGSVDREVARRSCTKERRVRDECALIDAYLARHPAVIAQGRPVIMMGTSEGADVAAAVAAREPRVTHLILLAGGGGWTQAEEFRHLLERGMVAIPDVRTVAELDARFEEIRRAPDADRAWFGHPYRRWASYLFERASDHLIGLDIPILLMHGSADTSVPVESARALRDRFLASGKSNLRYIEYAGVDHTLHEIATGRSVRPAIEIDTIAWLAELGVLPADAAAEFERRVRRAHPQPNP